MNRQAFNFYKSFDDVFNMLSEKQSGTLIKSILDVQFMRVHIEDITFKDVMLSMAWAGMKQSIFKQVDGFCKANSTTYNRELFAPKADFNDTSKANFTDTPQQVQEKGEVQGEVQEQGVLLPSTVDILLWNDFKKLRTKLKAPNTQRALNALKNKLIEFQNKGFDLNEIISTSYENGWKGLFEPKNKTTQQSTLSFKQQDEIRAKEKSDNITRLLDNGFDPFSQNDWDKLSKYESQIMQEHQQGVIDVQPTHRIS